jgi:hypothetical protein
LLWWNCSKESESTEIDAEYRSLVAAHLASGLEDGAVTAEDDHQIGIAFAKFVREFGIDLHDFCVGFQQSDDACEF